MCSIFQTINKFNCNKNWLALLLKYHQIKLWKRANVRLQAAECS